MTYPDYPTDDTSAIEYAKKLTEINEIPHFAIKRKEKGKTPFAINYAAVYDDEFAFLEKEWPGQWIKI